MRIALVYNQRMASARLARVAALARVLDRRGHETSHHDSQDFNARADAPGVDLICICGGDGTAQLVIAAQTDVAALPPVAVYPAGTINLLARELGYPADPRHFAARIEECRSPLPVRLAALNGLAFLCCVSVGADAHAVAALSEPLKARIGRLAYLAAMARALRDWPRTAIEVNCDGTVHRAEALFVLRGKFYAGPWTLDSQAGLLNDRLRVLILPRARRRDLAALALRTLLGPSKPMPGTLVCDARQVTVRSALPVPVQCDGDTGGTTPLEIAMTGTEVRFA
ncbi:diacylglycerol kinase family protein [Novosphingobium sp.]|uniref:diacylglycerol/lipid kinase family protein n=1 Tax=Novosphingobium sp. TaxID=1874826 RepID=UPI0035B0517E